MSNQTAEQILEQRVRDSAPLLERLADIRKRVGHMCSNHHGPKMTIPVAWYDDDFFIATTVKDAIAALSNAHEPIGLLAAANEVLRFYMPVFNDSRAVDDCLVGLAMEVEKIERAQRKQFETDGQRAADLQDDTNRPGANKHSTW